LLESDLRELPQTTAQPITSAIVSRWADGRGASPQSRADHPRRLL